MNDKTEKAAWPEFAIAIFDLMTGRKAEVTWEFDNMEVFVPMETGSNPEYAIWKLNGALKVRAREDYQG